MARWRGGWRRTLGAAVLAWLLSAAPAEAAVTIAFWSRDLGRYFPHAFISLRGVPDAGGEAVDAAYGFTARAITPALLFGTVAGTVERPTRGYRDGAFVHFSIVLSDARYRDILALIRAHDPHTGGDGRYHLGRRNCVHFVQEAARRAGLVGLDHPRLMKKPRRYLEAVAAGNAVTPVRLSGAAYAATLAPLSGSDPIAAPEGDPGTMPNTPPVS